MMPGYMYDSMRAIGYYIKDNFVNCRSWPFFLSGTIYLDKALLVIMLFNFCVYFPAAISYYFITNLACFIDYNLSSLLNSMFFFFFSNWIFKIKLPGQFAPNYCFKTNNIKVYTLVWCEIAAPISYVGHQWRKMNQECMHAFGLS